MNPRQAKHPRNGRRPDRIYAAHITVVRLPHGLFESVICLAVAVVEGLGDEVAEHRELSAPV